MSRSWYRIPRTLSTCRRSAFNSFITYAHSSTNSRFSSQININTIVFFINSTIDRCNFNIIMTSFLNNISKILRIYISICSRSYIARFNKAFNSRLVNKEVFRYLGTSVPNTIGYIWSNFLYRSVS